ncbi:MAG: 23S rRNA pseudouridine(1911/1915/1917) synthase RluD [Gammaproteobacteria bacterium]|nr:23S rRNA pseudouridine(1911/1915/1917) synthase RluD [Gammaproteobacteria bacterium]
MMEKIDRTIQIPESCQGMRLDQALANLLPDYSRSRLQSWIKAGFIKVNDCQMSQREKLSGGELIHIHIHSDADEISSGGQNIPLEIIYEDKDVIIINKPAGLIVHPGAGNPDNTLYNALLYHYPDLDTVPRAGIIQRLDKDTSGIMVIARSLIAHTYLVRDLQERKINREYQAIIHGSLTAGRTIDAPIGRHPVKRTRMAVVNSGKPAITHVRVLTRFNGITHVLAKLETGRTHQIRVHMAHIHHPVVGDPIYGGRARHAKDLNRETIDSLNDFPRQALHAWRLQLIHPQSSQQMTWTADLPEDMNSLLSLLKNECSG